LEQAAKLGNHKLGALLTKHQRYMEELLNLQPSSQMDFNSILDTSTATLLEGAHIIEWGEKHMDDYAGGMTRTEMTVLGGRPGNGKTTLMVNLIDTLTMNDPRLKICVFNREMSNTSAISKLLVLNSSKLTTNTFRKKYLEDWEREEIWEVKEKIGKKYPNLRMYDNIVTLEDTMTEIRKWQPDIIFDDYVQLIKVDGKRSRDRRFEIEDIVNEYKWVLKKINASALLLSQLSREIEKRIDNTPTMADYSEGGTLEQGAETCMFVYYPYYFDPNNNPDNVNEVIVKKARYGRIGTYKVGFSGEKCQFFNRALEKGKKHDEEV
jgi:replicative DNA helicase